MCINLPNRVAVELEALRQKGCLVHLLCYGQDFLVLSFSGFSSHGRGGGWSWLYILEASTFGGRMASWIDLETSA